MTTATALFSRSMTRNKENSVLLHVFLILPAACLGKTQGITSTSHRIRVFLQSSHVLLYEEMSIREWTV